MNVNLDELMKKYKAGTPGTWRKNGDGISSNELVVLSAVLEGTTLYDAIAKVFIDIEDLDLIVALHNSFPAIVERIRVAEKMAEIIENKSDDECPFVGISEIECRKAGYSCNQCVRSNLRKVALAKLGLKEDNDNGQ